jgi:hypothetical protein
MTSTQQKSGSFVRAEDFTCENVIMCDPYDFEPKDESGKKTGKKVFVSQIKYNYGNGVEGLLYIRTPKGIVSNFGFSGYTVKGNTSYSLSLTSICKDPKYKQGVTNFFNELKKFDKLAQLHAIKHANKFLSDDTTDAIDTKMEKYLDLPDKEQMEKRAEEISEKISFSYKSLVSEKKIKTGDRKGEKYPPSISPKLTFNKETGKIIVNLYHGSNIPIENPTPEEMEEALPKNCTPTPLLRLKCWKVNDSWGTKFQVTSSILAPIVVRETAPVDFGALFGDLPAMKEPEIKEPETEEPETEEPKTKESETEEVEDSEEAQEIENSEEEEQEVEESESVDGVVGESTEEEVEE